MKYLGRGWRTLYEVVKKNGRECFARGSVFLIMTKFSGFPIRDPEDPRYYGVTLRCGWTPETHIPSLGGTVGGLTREQWLFINKSRPKYYAILAVGPVWPGLQEAIRRAREAGVEVEM